MSKPKVQPQTPVVAPQQRVQLTFEPSDAEPQLTIDNSGGAKVAKTSPGNAEYTAGKNPGLDVVTVVSGNETTEVPVKVMQFGLPDPIRVETTMRQPGEVDSEEKYLWLIIRNRTEAISFPRYERFMNEVMCGGRGQEGAAGRELKYRGRETYRYLERATEAYLMHECGLRYDRELATADDAAALGWTNADLDPAKVAERRAADLDELLEGEEGKVLPFFANLRRALADLPLKPGRAANCYGILRDRIEAPCLLELIWSYWHEEAMLVQTLNAVSLRFQNKRHPGRADALSRFDLSPLRPLTNLLWGYVQDEQHRLTVPRRAYEYDHHYGLTLFGKAVPQLQSADSRSRFLEAFHNLLHVCSMFYKQADNTFVVADGFPVLNALKDVHLLLAEGMHNQYGDLPWTARVEMLIQMWLLARPEMQEFLGGRISVPYRENWMSRVDTMRGMLGLGDTSVTHFNDLARFGEQILLSVRFGAWSNVFGRGPAAAWAIAWRDAIQGYIHAYRAVTGVDLSAAINARRVDATLPSIHLRNRLAAAGVARRP